MLSIKLLREHPDTVKSDLTKRGDTEKTTWIDEILQDDKHYLQLLREVEELRAARNKLARSIAEKKKANEDSTALLQEASSIPAKIKDLEANYEMLYQRIQYKLMRLPNILHESVPEGKDDTENKVVRTWGDPKKQEGLKSHVQLLEDLNLADFERATKIAGSGFYFMKGALVQLNQALLHFALNHLIAKGFVAIEPPIMMQRKPYEGVTDLTDFENVMYPTGDHYLIATAEHPIAAMHMNEIIEPNSLPLAYAGISPCFRKEIGSHGIDTKGLFRTHQFSKVEQFVFCKPEESWHIFEQLIVNAEELFQQLELPYRIVNVCTGDIGTVAAKKYDLEVWMPRQGIYREAVSCSNCTDYQSRRLKIRMGKVGAGEKQLVHTLNSTALATGRVLVAIVEHYQKNDGIIVPSILRPFVGKDILKP